MKKLKNERKFLEQAEESNSYYDLHVGKSDGALRLKLTDCYRGIEWYFAPPRSPKAIKKITALKSLVDRMYIHLTGESNV